MLGCQDFCGYYDWTFHYVNRRYDRNAVEKLWSKAIVDAQSHYAEAGAAKGLRGLYETWVQTGEDEHCDWTFTLDEKKNVLRWDMRQCPSKGHLIDNDLYADEDYCDHCMGWMIPTLNKVGAEVVVHEHNHCGQCWGEMRIAERPYESLAGRDGDITTDPRWARGYIERWSNDQKLPLLQAGSKAADPVEVLRGWFLEASTLTVLGRGPSAADHWAATQTTGAVIVTDPTYATQDVYAPQPRGVLIGDRSQSLEKVAERFSATPPNERPLLMHMYLPGVPMMPFADYGLPRPVPILPLLVREGLYRHEPHAPYPTTGVFALLLAAALDKPTTVAGIDLYRHPNGQMYVGQPPSQLDWPSHHSEACDKLHIRNVMQRLDGRFACHPFLSELMLGVSK